MAVYEVFKHAGMTSVPSTIWHYFDQEGKYLGDYTYLAGQGGNYYILDGKTILPSKFIGICKEDEKFIFYQSGSWAIKTFEQMTELLWPHNLKPSFLQVLINWTAGYLNTPALPIVMKKVFPDTEEIKASVHRFAWTLSHKGVEHAV